MTIPFARTVCACPADIENCSRPGYLIPDDVAAIDEVLRGRGEHVPARWFEASRGAIVADSTTGHRFRIATIVPRRHRGSCVFLDGHRRCTIHETAPYGCAFFDVHQSWLEWQRRTVWGLQQVRGDQTYAAIWETLAFRDGGAQEPFVVRRA